MSKTLTIEQRVARIEAALAEYDTHIGAVTGDQSRAARPNLAAIVDEQAAR